MPIESFVPLATQVALALEEHGVPHQLDVGTSGFRIPIAVHQPEDPTRFALAVLTDEGREDVGAFERHVHRPAVLRMRGWDVMYVTSATWRRRREHVLNEIFERVPNVRGALENEVWRAFREKLKAVPKEVPAPRTTIEPTKASKAQEPPAKAPPVPADENLPDWAQAIEPPRFARALIHIARHGSLSETELFNIVGGPRQGRKFAREIDNLTNVLPFRVELSVAGTAKTYLRR